MGNADLIADCSAASRGVVLVNKAQEQLAWPCGNASAWPPALVARVDAAVSSDPPTAYLAYEQRLCILRVGLHL